MVEESALGRFFHFGKNHSITEVPEASFAIEISQKVRLQAANALSVLRAGIWHKSGKKVMLILYLLIGLLCFWLFFKSVDWFENI